MGAAAIACMACTTERDLRVRPGSRAGRICGWDYSSLLRRVALIVVDHRRAGDRDPETAVVSRMWSQLSCFSPLILTILWLAGRELGVVDSFWRFDSATGLATWAATITLTFAACFALARQPQDGQWLTMISAGVIVTLAAIFSRRPHLRILRPSYSIRNASLALQQRFPPGSVVRTFGAESLFLGNTLAFRVVAPGETGYDGIVIFEHGLQSRLLLVAQGANLVKVQSYPMTVHSRYRMDEEKFGPASIGVYRLR